MKRNLLILSLGSLLLWASPKATAQSLGANPTLNFSNQTGFGDNIAQDGEGGSTAINGFNILVMPINSSGTKFTTDILEYHDMDDWGTPAMIAIATNPHYGWAIKSDNGNDFSLQSFNFFDWGGWDGSSFVVQAFKDGASKGMVTFNGNTDNNMVTLSSPASLTNIFQQVDEVRIYKQNEALSWTGINNIRVGSPSSVLPVSWLSFTATKNAHGVALNWSTAGGEEKSQFFVQRSGEGSGWQTIGTVGATAGSTPVHSYSFIDRYSAPGSTVYRIMQREANGRESYSKVVKIDGEVRPRLSVYPNPVVNGSLSINLSQASGIAVFNSAGVAVTRKYLPAGTQVLLVDGLPKGHYFIQSAEGKASFVIQ